jgi:hypothetical protein
MKKNIDKNFEGQNETQRARATLLYSKSNTNLLNATKRKRKKKKKRNINPKCKQNTHLSLTTKQRMLIYAQKIDPQERKIIKPRKSIPPNYKHI